MGNGEVACVRTQQPLYGPDGMITEVQQYTATSQFHVVAPTRRYPRCWRHHVKIIDVTQLTDLAELDQPL
jgi:hypothetical protein